MLCDWRNRVREPLALVKTLVNDPHPRVRLEAVRACSFFTTPKAAEIALEGVRQENEVGARTILDILDAEQELLDSQVDLVRSQRDEIVAGFQVLAAIGRLIAGDLDLAVDVYEPEIDYLNVRNAWFSLGSDGKD